MALTSPPDAELRPALGRREGKGTGNDFPSPWCNGPCTLKIMGRRTLYLDIQLPP
jgi:hypothetical protein